MSSDPYGPRPPRGGYRGPDRRTAPAPADAPWSVGFLVAGCALLATWVAVSLGFADSTEHLVLAGALSAAAAAVAAVAAMLAALWWRISGRAPVLLLAVALAVLAAAFALRGVLDAFPRLVGPAPAAARVAGLLVVAGLVTGAAVSPDIDTRRRPLRVIGLAAAAVALLTPLLAVVGAGAGGLLPPAAGQRAESVVLAAALLAVAVVSIVRAARADRFIFAWFGLLLFGLTLVEFTAVLGQVGVRGSVGRALIELASVLMALTGIAHELYSAFAGQRHRLLESLIEGRAAVARVHAQHATARQQAHDAYSALAAIEGASRTLERSHDRLDAGTRTALTAGIASEIARLQRVIGPPTPPDARVPFDLAATLRPVIAHERADGTDVVADVREGLTAFGRASDTAEAVARLLRLARDRAPGRPVLVRTDWAAGKAVVRIVDRGEGDPAPRDLDLAVCAQLVDDQGGELRIERRGGGGTTYALSLAAVGGPAEDGAPLPAGAEGVDKQNQRGQIAEVDGLLAERGDETPHHRASGPGGQQDDGVGDDPVRKGPGDDRDVEAGGTAPAAVDDDDVEAVARDDARERIAQQPRFERDRHPPPDRPGVHDGS